MKNVRINLWSFTTVKLQAIRLCRIAALVAVIGFGLTACDDGGGSTTTTTYTVTVNNGNGSGSYAPGANVTITATVPSGQQFTNWTVNSGGATLANANSTSTSFTMPANNVTVTANFSSTPNPNTSLNGVWMTGNYSGQYQEVTISGNSGSISSINFTSGAWADAINKGYVKVGDQFWRNLTSTGNLTWSGQELYEQHYNSSPNVAIGTTWVNCTITMSADGQTINSGEVTFRRVVNTSLNGIWLTGNYNGQYQEVTISGNSGSISSINFTSGAWADAINKGYVKVGDQFWRNLTSTGNLTWSGQELYEQHYNSSPNVAIGTTWVNCTITMSANGQTITSGGNTYTRQ